MLVFSGGTVVAQHPYGIRNFGIVGNDRASITARPKVLGGIEAKARNIAYGSHSSTVVASAVGLRRVFDHTEAV